MATTKSSTNKTPKTPAKQAVPATTPVAVKPVIKVTPKATPRTAPKAAATQSATNSRAKKAVGISAEQRRNYVEVAAFYIAERRGFAPGNLLDDWVQAEAEIDRLLAGGHLGG